MLNGRIGKGKAGFGMGVVDDDLDKMGRAYPKQPLVRFSAIGEAWELLLQRWPLWVLTVLIVMVCYSALSGVVFSMFGIPVVQKGRPFWIGLSRPRLAAAHFVVSTVVIGLFVGGMFRMACRQVRGQAVGLETPFGVLDVLPQLLLGSVLYALATYAGFCVLVLPGFIISGILMFTLPLIVDGRLEATDALAQSWRALKDQWLVAAVFHAVAGFVAWMGVCCCGVGLLLTAPLYCLAIAVLYRDFFMVK
jgi:hypothetical protein